MATEHWFRWHHGTVTDPKWRVVANRAASNLSRNVTVGHVVAVWAAMMECASQATPRGELVGWCDEDIAAALGFEEVEVAAISAAMQGKTLDDAVLMAWKRRQVKAEDVSAADRKRAQRERDKSHDVTADNLASRNVTAGHDRVEESRGEQEHKDSLRSSSSPAEPPTKPLDSLPAEAAQRLAVVTDDAIAAYNAILARPRGVLPKATAIGIEEKRRWVKRVLPIAKQICQDRYGDTRITPDFWKGYFGACAQDPFKSGRQEPGRGHENWKPDFEYLTRKDVMIEVFDQATSDEDTADAAA